MRLNRQRFESAAWLTGNSPWQYAAHTTIHEAIHIRDFARYGTCSPWTDDTMRIMMTANGGHPHTLQGYENYTHQRTLERYEAQLGVPSPRDPEYDAANNPSHRNISCPLH